MLKTRARRRRPELSPETTYSLKWTEGGFEQAGMANGRFIINTIATSKDNEFWTSGLQLGDEVLAANGIPWKQITLKQKNNLFQKEKIIFDIIRNKRKMQIVVNINKNNIVGD